MRGRCCVWILKKRFFFPPLLISKKKNIEDGFCVLTFQKYFLDYLIINESVLIAAWYFSLFHYPDDTKCRYRTQFTTAIATTAQGFWRETGPFTVFNLKYNLNKMKILQSDLETRWNVSARTWRPVKVAFKLWLNRAAPRAKSRATYEPGSSASQCGV